MKIIIFGTGDSAKNFLNDIEESINIIAFADNNQAMWGKSLNNITIINPAKILELDYDYIIICSMFTKEIIESLLARGIKRDKIIAYYDNFYTKEDREKELFILNKITKQKKKGNKNIALLTRRNSGCNCLALYKNVLPQIKDNFTVSLVGLEEYKQRLREFEVVFTTHMESRNYRSMLNIETWHGFPLKTLGFLEKNCIDNITRADSGIDYIISYSNFYNYIMSSVYKIDIRKFIVTGMPRNDLLANAKANDYISLLLNRKIENKRIIFYVPTFRSRKGKEKREGIEIFSQISELKLIDEYMREIDGYFIIKKHPVEEDLLELNNYTNIFFLTDENLTRLNIDFYEILGGSDILITDYSSVYFDYLLLNKPIIFWTKDIDLYKERRGFLFENVEVMMPGPRVKTAIELTEMIDRFINNPDWYSDERENIKKQVHLYDDFNSSQRVWNVFLDIYNNL